MELQAQGIYPYFIPLEGSEGTEVEIGGQSLIMIGSNNYLGLTHHPAVRAAAIEAIERYGTSCSGSRFLNGTLELHEELERRLAKFMGQEAALCFSTGFQANLGAISAICGKNDIILCDRENHASIIDGCRLSFADTRKFRHSDVEDLERQLALAQQQQRAVLIVVDGLYSMMGDLAPLQDIRALADQYGARLMVDEAHGIGVLGDHGRGAAHGRVTNCGMFDRGENAVGAAVLRSPRSHGDGFGGAAGEHDLSGAPGNQPGHLIPGRLDGDAGGHALDMDARWVAPEVGECRDHGRSGLDPKRGGRGVVEVAAHHEVGR